MNKVIRILEEKRGNMLLTACVVVLALFLLFTVISEYIRLQLITKSVRDTLETSIISVAVQNYDDLYNGLREGYSGGYYLSASGYWEGRVDNGNIYAYLDNLLGLTKQGSYHIKKRDGKTEYKISELQVNVKNTDFAVIGSSRRFESEALILLEVPLSFGWDMLPALKLRIKADAGYTPKF